MNGMNATNGITANTATTTHRSLLRAAPRESSSPRAAADALRWLRRPRLQRAEGALLPVLLFGLWQLAAHRHWLPEQILPSPSLVWQSLAELSTSGDLWKHLAASLSRIGWSLTIGGSIGLLLGVAMGLSRQSRAYLQPSFDLVSQFPVVGWIPLLIIFVGLGERLEVSAISLAVVVPVAVNAQRAMAGLPATLVDVARVHRFSPMQVLARVVWPATAPGLFNGFRQGVMQAWVALVFVELLASSEGIGYLMVWGRQLLQLDLVVVGMVVIGTVGVALDLLLRTIERRVLGWRQAGF